MKYKISKEAAKDLENIWVYTFEKWSITGRQIFWSAYGRDRIRFSKPLCRERLQSYQRRIFSYPVKSHFIFYKIDTVNDFVEIIRILHQQMDINERLGE